MGHDHEGQRVSRRRLITGISSLGLGAVLSAPGARAGAASRTATGDLASLLAGSRVCKLTPTATQGPYYFDADKIRSDIRENKPGVRLRMGIRVQDSETCSAMGNAVVEIWHCDAAGVYSGAEKESKDDAASGPPPGGFTDVAFMSDMKPSDEYRYLRGAQVTNADGIVEFTTIWPGWYPGRTVHIHTMVHFSDRRVLNTQIMFDDALNAKVLAMPPYAAHTGRDTFNSADNIFRDGMMLQVIEDGDGYLGTIILSADSDTDGG
ncbi:intradiol ring-cleavage dioxygenase [Nonomuraea sp. NPDC049625]|uniref:intradiol ring-cleavage dioxygenase n=1 Tax=Nonomuraea sp. NPDC049625 TaxID=3155775 RepID=UPI00342CEF93